MSIGYEVKADTKQLEEAIDLFRFIGGNINDAMRIAINKSGPKIKTLSSKEIRGQIRLKAGYVNERMKFVRASTENLTGKITTPSRGLLLSRFSTDTAIANDGIKWSKAPAVPARGIRVKVKPSGSTKIVKGDSETQGKPFYLVLKNSKAIGIAARLKGSTKLKVFYGPSLSQVFNTVKDDVMPTAADEYTKQLADAMRYILQKRKPQE